MNATRIVMAGMLASIAAAVMPGFDLTENATADVCVTVEPATPYASVYKYIDNRFCTGVFGEDAVSDNLCVEIVCNRPIYSPLTGEPVARVEID